jgi:hypothetical protein
MDHIKNEPTKYKNPPTFFSPQKDKNSPKKYKKKPKKYKNGPTVFPPKKYKNPPKNTKRISNNTIIPQIKQNFPK